MSESSGVFAYDIHESVLRIERPGTHWIASASVGGFQRADAAYNITVPEGFERVDLSAYAAERREAAAYEEKGPTLFTGVAQAHARIARTGPVEVVATAGLSNPAALPMGRNPDTIRESRNTEDDHIAKDSHWTWRPGTVNVVAGTEKSLPEGALVGLVGVIAEAKAATLLAETGFPGTTTDAIVAGCDPAGESIPFAGSATAVGEAARICVRDAVRASLRSRYDEQALPTSVADARHGVETDGQAEVFRPQ